MEGEFDFMNFNFNQEMNIDEELPFGNWSEAEKYNNSNDNFFSFLKINYNSSPDTEKKFLQGEQIIEKLNEFEESYSNIIHKSIISSPTQNLNDKIKGNLDSNLLLAEGTLPGLLISIMFKENSPVTQNFLLGKIGDKFDELRKLNGAKYRGDINKVLKSALSSSGLFFQTEENKFFFKEKEALNYIIKVTEKVLTKKFEKNIKDSKTSSTAKTSNKSKSTSSVNNNFNSTLSISSIGGNSKFGNIQSSIKSKNKKITNLSDLPQIIINCINPTTKNNCNNNSKKNTKSKKIEENNLNSLKLDKPKVKMNTKDSKFHNFFNDINIKSNSNNTNITCPISNFNKYDYTNRMDTNGNLTNRIEQNMLGNNLTLNNENHNNNNNANTKTIKKR